MNVNARVLAITAALVATLAAALAVPASATPPQVRVAMRASWASTSVLQEAAEMFREHNTLFAFLDAAAAACLGCGAPDRDALAALTSDAQFADVVGDDAAVLRLALGLGTYSPAVEASRHVAATHLAALAVPPCAEDVVLVVGPAHVWCGRDAIVAAAASGAVADATAAGANAPVLNDAVAAGLVASTGNGPPVAALFGALGSPHAYAAWAAAAAAVPDGLVFAHIPASPNAPRQPLTGYGVELTIKSTEYKVVDEDDAGEGDDDADADVDADATAATTTTSGIDFATLIKRDPSARRALRALSAELDAPDSIKPLKKYQLRDLGLKAAAMIVASPTPAQTMARLAHRLPALTHTVAARSRPSGALKEEVTATARALGVGAAALAVNGRELAAATVSPHDVFALVAAERKVSAALGAAGIPAAAVAAVASVVGTAPAAADGAAVRVKVDDPRFIVYANNLARDDMYASWPRSVATLLQPSQGFHKIRRNVVTLLFVADPGVPASLATIYQLAQFHRSAAPLRFGLVFASDPAAPDPALSATIIRTAVAVRTEAGSAAVWQLLASVAAFSRGGVPTPAHLDAALGTLEGWDGPATVAELLSGDVGDGAAADADAALAYAAAIALPAHTFVLNALVLDASGNIQATLVNALRAEEARLAALVGAGQISDSVNVFKWVNNEPGVLAAFSPLVVPSKANPLRITALPPALFARSTAWTGDADAMVSIWVVGNTVDEHVGCVADTVAAWIAAPRTDLSVRYTQIAPDTSDPWDVVGVALVVNGRVIDVPAEAACTSFSAADVGIVVDMEARERAGPVIAAVKASGGGIDGPWADAVAAATAAVWADERRGGSGRMAPLFSTGAAATTSEVTFGASVAGSSIVITAVIDPVSAVAQRLVPMLDAVASAGVAAVRVRLNPVPTLDSVPLDTFYEYAIDAGVAFDSAGAREVHGASFAGVPTEYLLTLGVEGGDGWLVEPVVADADLDNLRLGEGKATVDAVFELTSLLVEGRAYQLAPIEPPTGLELVLGTANEASVQDTVVMANLGYFQLKASPGLWRLGLRDGRPSEAMYSMLNVSSFDVLYQGSGASVDALRVDDGVGRPVAVSSFGGASVSLVVAKKAGMEEKKLLDDGGGVGEALASMWSSITGSEKTGDNAKINIFSVASGHLYERFLKIMIKSVLANTDKPVKFWFIRQFLSPSFKDFIPAYAAAAGFEYELVTYKWPRWLNGQTEKQRLIWGYKILFLDVIFPLDLEKVIFVDADQIVRADMNELVEMDLDGAPYGFTPFCNSNEETEGFRFWKQGYWASHLRGKPYHISALFVIDLKRFRAMSAGDTLRGTYQSLSQDPNSLSNLDQDLPNYLQHQVPIFSLPQEWLWCEAWCGWHTLDAAKTIDLCNNPMTKMPKLDNAKRFDEWVQYDGEVKAIADAAAAHPAPTPPLHTELHTEL